MNDIQMNRWRRQKYHSCGERTEGCETCSPECPLLAWLSGSLSPRLGLSQQLWFWGTHEYF